MNKFLPSGKFLLILASIIIALGIIFGAPTIASYFSSKKVTAPAVKSNEQISIKEFMAIDTDQDGLLDWEEALWKTDPKKTDTDNDGTSDGEEADLNRNPTITNTAQKGKTPNDLIDEQIIADAKKAQADYNKLSETEKFSRELFSQYVVAKNNSDGKALDNNTKMEILNSVIDKTSGTIVNKYTATDIKHIATTSPQNLKLYGNLLGLILIKYSTDGTGNELFYIEQALTKEDETILKNLTPIIKNYNLMLSDFLEVPTPDSLLDIHTRIVNNLYNVIISLEDAKTFFSNSIKGISGLQTYQSSYKDLFANIETLRIKMLERNVVFGVTDPGYVFINTLQQ